MGLITVVVGSPPIDTIYVHHTLEKVLGHYKLKMEEGIACYDRGVICGS